MVRGLGCMIFLRASLGREAGAELCGTFGAGAADVKAGCRLWSAGESVGDNGVVSKDFQGPLGDCPFVLGVGEHVQSRRAQRLQDVLHSLAKSGIGPRACLEGRSRTDVVLPWRGWLSAGTSAIMRPMPKLGPGFPFSPPYVSTLRLPCPSRRGDIQLERPGSGRSLCVRTCTQ